MADSDQITLDDENSFVTRADAKRMVQQAVAEAMLYLSRAPAPIKVFGLTGSNEYAKKVAASMGIKLTPHVDKVFDDGEGHAKSASDKAGNVRGHDVFVIQSLFGDGKRSVCDKFVELCMFCGSLRDASAEKITAVIPHLAWARQDRKTESRAPISTKYVAQMLESIGVNRCLFIDVHNLAAQQNAYRIPIDVLEVKNLHAKWCADRLIAKKSRKVRVVSPDSGGLPRCTRFRNALAGCLGEAHPDNIEICIYDKVRDPLTGQVTGGRIIGDIADADAIIYDDLISTATTMGKAYKAVNEAGGHVLSLAAAHGVCCGKVNEVFDQIGCPIVLADTIAPYRLSAANRDKIEFLDTSKMVGDAMMRIHRGTGSISELLEAPKA